MLRRHVFDEHIYHHEGDNRNRNNTDLQKFMYAISRDAYGHHNRHFSDVGEDGKPMEVEVQNISGTDTSYNEHKEGAVICDMVAVAIALNGIPAAIPSSHADSHIVKSSVEVNVEVETEGKYSRGQTVVDWGCYDAVVRLKNCHWVTDISTEYYVDMFCQAFKE